MAQSHRTKQFDVPYVDVALLSILVPRVHGYLRDYTAHLPNLQLHLPAALSSIVPSINLDDADIHNLIQLLLSAIMAFITIGRGVGTPAMNSLGLILTQEPQQRGSCSNGTINPKVNSIRRVATYVFLSGLLPTLYRMARKRWEEDRAETMNAVNVTSSEVQDMRNTNNVSQVEILARQRRKKLLDGVMTFIAFVVPPARLANHLCFVLGTSSSSSSNSNTSTEASSTPPPTLPMRIAGLSYADEQHGQHHINYAYAYRRVLYEQMFSLAQILSPPARQVAALPSSFAGSLTRLRQKAQMYVQQMLKKGGNRDTCFVHQQSDCTGYSGSQRSCSICRAHPITMPYASSCGRDVYCYYCIRFALLDNDDYRGSQTYRRANQ